VNRNTFTVAVIAVALAALVSAALIRTYAQPPPPHYFAFDQRAYISMADAPLVNTRDTYLPASWRILPPLIARVIGQITGLGSERGF